VVKQLAEAVNDPIEHPTKPEPEPAPEPPAPPVTTPAETVKGGVKNDLGQFPIDYNKPPSHYGAPRGYTWHIGSDGDIIEGVATNGVRWVCVFCMDTDHKYDALNPRGIGGHRRYFHSESGAEFIEKREEARSKTSRTFSEEDRTRSVAARQARRKRDRDLREAIEVMCRAINYYPTDPNAPEPTTDEVRAGLVAELMTERDEWKAKAENAEARLALLREAMSA